MLTGQDLGAAIEAARRKKGVSKKALAAEFGVTPPSVQDWVKRGTIDKQKLPALWRYFSDVVGPSHWGLESWIETQHPPEGVDVHPVAQEMSPSPYYAGRPLSAVRVPVIGTLDMGTTGMHILVAGESGAPIGTVEAYSSSDRAFAVRVNGDDLYPVARHGSCLVVEPGGECVSGELILIELSDGHYLVRELVAVRDDTLIVLPVNGGARTTISRKRVVEMHPVSSVVSGSKFRT